jgi:gamma-tubulin complex component 5
VSPAAASARRRLTHAQTAALDRAVLAILDDAVRFGALAAAHVGGERTLDLSLSLAQHRSRRARRARRNVVGPAPAAESSSDEDEDDAAPLETSTFALVRAEDDGGPGADRLARMAAALDAHVRIMRRGVEALAAGTDDGAETFGVLAFALEDWDR